MSINVLNTPGLRYNCVFRKVSYFLNFSVPERLGNIYIDVSNNPDGSSAQTCFHDTQPYLSSETKVYSCHNPIQGRYVRIRFPQTTRQCLQLVEVQVQGNKGLHANISENKYEPFPF